MTQRAHYLTLRVREDVKLWVDNEQDRLRRQTGKKISVSDLFIRMRSAYQPADRIDLEGALALAGVPEKARNVAQFVIGLYETNYEPNFDALRASLSALSEVRAANRKHGRERPR